MKRSYTFAAIGVLLTGYAVAFAACFPADKQIEAAGGYYAQQLACVDTYSDRHNIDACRAKVKAAWAVADAGAEGGDR